MICFETHIGLLAYEFFTENQEYLLDFTESNSITKKVSGINNFFTSQEQANELLERIKEQSSMVSEPDRREYGDFQTNERLTQNAVEYAFSKFKNIEFVLEPTCGKGNFLIASIKQSQAIKKVVGVEIYQPYIWETKFKILEYFLSTKYKSVPEIDIIHANAFAFPFEELADSTRSLKTLVIGNPPWVTNSELSSIDSKNLPAKSNFKNHSGFDAITGKGNFDIGEYISLIMLKCFDKHDGIFAFLIKSSVVKNIIQDQKQNKFRINRAEKLNIDSKKEFNVSVNACLFVAHFNSEPDFTCKEYNLYSHEPVTNFGWYKDKFVYSIQDYDESSIVDGKSCFIWRSGVKHDCSKVMELEQVNSHFRNALGEEIKLENNLTYALLKSSDLKEDKATNFRRMTIITQQKIGQDTKYIKEKYPLTFEYLNTHKEYFDNRKSSIYKNKPSFSIFGIGDYSFKPYKVAVSGLYKSTHFSLVLPFNNKPIMLDDTCYFIGFDSKKMAEIAHYIVNSELVQRFLKSIIFSDSKRAINKDTLMRIDFLKAYENIGFQQVKRKIKDLEIKDWEAFGKIIKGKPTEQMTLF